MLTEDLELKIKDRNSPLCKAVPTQIEDDWFKFKLPKNKVTKSISKSKQTFFKKPKWLRIKIIQSSFEA